MSAAIRLDLLVVGRVQGVGFRASTVAIAAQHGVTGYVRNLPDGNVEVVAEGTDEAVHAFWRALSQHRIYRHVRSEHPRTGMASGRFGGFSIRYD